MWPTVVRRCSSAAIPFRLSNSTPISSSPRFSTVGPRPTATSIRSHSTVSPSPVHGQRGARVFDLRALLLEVERDPALAKLLRQLLRGVLVLSRNQPRQHLDDRHLGAEAPEDRGELAADEPTAENDQSARHLGLGE